MLFVFFVKLLIICITYLAELELIDALLDHGKWAKGVTALLLGFVYYIFIGLRHLDGGRRHGSIQDEYEAEIEIEMEEAEAARLAALGWDTPRKRVNYTGNGTFIAPSSYGSSVYGSPGKAAESAVGSIAQPKSSVKKQKINYYTPTNNRKGMLDNSAQEDW